jgi:DNA-binding CsgD family transcriptional regulator
MSRSPTPAVVGRDEELGFVEEFLADVERGPTALVLSGEPGIGKTVLWEAGVELARERYDYVLIHRSVEAEAMLSFAGLSDLLIEVFDEVAPSLAPLRRRALEVALVLAEPGKEAPDPRALGLALLDVLRVLAQHGPVVVALDDVQWLDASSAGVLQIALRRLRDEPVGVLATLRKMPGVAAPIELERAFPEERFERLWLGPLNLGALRRLLLDRLGLELTRPELARVQEMSGGNPFFALELGRELLRTGTRLAAGQALRIPESLHELLGDRLARLPTGAGDVLLVAATHARPTVEMVVAMHGSREIALEGLVAAEREGVVELEGARVRFIHPLLASICYEQAPPWKRRAVHRALADALDDVEDRAHHLAAAAERPDATVAAALESAAEHAAARGAIPTAAELSELAAGMTTDDAAPARRRRRLRAARFQRLGGGADRAVAMLESLLRETGSGVERSDALFELASTLRQDPASTIALCDEALVEAGDDDARSARILGFRGWLRLYQADVRAALADARAALQRAERVGDPVLVAGAIGNVATAERRAGEITPGLLERGREIEERLGLLLPYNESPRVALVRRMIGLGELDRARTILEDLEHNVTARGNEEYRWQIVYGLMRVDWLAGRYQAARDRHTIAAELGAPTGDSLGHTLSGWLRTLIETDLGAVESARASAADALEICEAMALEEWAILTRGALGRLELALGDLEAAGSHVRELPRRLLALGYGDPTIPVWADTIETLIALGEDDRAGEYLEHYQAHAQRIASPLAIACAARCCGLLAAARGDLTGAFAAFERALGQVEGLPYPLERARTLLCVGSAHRQAKHKRAARDALEQALAIFEELGARLWAERTRGELRRISGRRRASEALTETEQRVARLAAQGRSNKQIAAELYMSVHTVGAHLSHTYRKLGLRSRSELAARLTEGVKTTNDGVEPTNEAAKL